MTPGSYSAVLQIFAGVCSVYPSSPCSKNSCGITGSVYHTLLFPSVPSSFFQLHQHLACLLSRVIEMQTDICLSSAWLRVIFVILSIFSRICWICLAICISPIQNCSHWTNLRKTAVTTPKKRCPQTRRKARKECPALEVKLGLNASDLKALCSEIILNWKLRLRFWGGRGEEEGQESQLVKLFASVRYREERFLQFRCRIYQCAQVKQHESYKISQEALVVIYRDHSFAMIKGSFIHFYSFS